MSRSFLPLLALFALLGASAAFFKQAVPHQEPKPHVAPAATANSALFDELDNPDVVSDSNITPARKCGFCIGVSGCLMFFENVSLH
ncbi:hypothetical protein HJC23_003707 [Cyclotella cryptica]|uniref:Uncharacterized protein n=1 Tax=Cyclotella cryptica TaxID=29204 RepID=A0ABD3QTY3_9STRA